MVLAAVLILMDLRWGIAAAKKRGEIIRCPKAARKTINKAVDYLCWITIAGLLELIFANKWTSFLGVSVEGISLGQLLLVIFIYVIEFNSCYTNYCDARGIKVRWNILGWISNKTSLEKEEHEE